MEFKEKTPEELEALTAKEYGEYIAEKNKAEKEAIKADFDAQIKALKESSESDSEATKGQIEKLETSLKTITKELDAQIARVKSISETKVGKDRSMTPIKEALLANKEKIASLKETKGSVELEVKAIHNPSDITDRNELGQFIPGVGEIPYQRQYIRDDFQQLPSNTEYIKYVDQATIVRDAKNVAACAASTHNSKVTFEVRDLQMKKVRDFTDVCIDMMEDYDFVEGQIRKLVDVDLMLKTDSDLLLGDGISANINGIDSYSSTFSASSAGANYAGKITAASIIDLFVVAGAQIKSFGAENFWMPTTIQMNPVDATLMTLLKDTDTNYIKGNIIRPSVFRDQGGTLYINGMKVVENPNVPQNEAYIYDARQGTIYNRRGKVVELSYENSTNFEQELVTVKAYERLNLLVKNSQANAFMHIADIEAGIAAITPT